MRWVQTRTSSEGLVPNLDALIVEADRVTVTVPAAGQTSLKAKYSSFLPSLNIRYNLTPELVIRGAAARVIGRPGLGQLNAGTSVDANIRSISSGNPALRPYKSDQLDLSLEYYFARGGLLSVAGFYKHLTDYIVSGQTTETHTVTYRSGGSATLEFRRNQPLNLLSGDVKGLEVAAQLPLSYVTGTLDGFGLFGNYTYIDAPSIPRTQGGQAFRWMASPGTTIMSAPISRNMASVFVAPIRIAVATRMAAAPSATAISCDPMGSWTGRSATS